MFRSFGAACAVILSFSSPLNAQSLQGGYLGNGMPATTANFLPGFSGAYLAGRHAATQSNVDEAGAYFSKALARDPRNPALMEQTLIYQTAAGRVLAAIPIAKHLAEFQPDHRMANLIMTVDDFAAGRFEQAKARLEARPDAFHPLVGALMAGWAAQGLGETEQTTAFDGLDDRAIFRIFSGYHKGLIAAADGDLDASTTAFETAIKELRAPTGRMARGYGAVLRLKGDDAKAREVYEAAIGVSVGDATLEAEVAALDAGEQPKLLVSSPREGAAEALFGLASALSQDGEARLSLFYTRLAEYLRPGFADAALLAAEILEGQKQYELAVASYESIAADSPLSRSAEIGRAEALHRLGKNDKAVEALTSLARHEPNAVDVHLALGDLMRRLERFEEGAIAYDAAIKLLAKKGRENWVLYYERGICHERSDQWDLAEADFHKALELSPDQPLVLNYLGYSWLDKGMNFELALDHIRKAVEQRPEDGYIIDSLGWGYYLTGDYKNAVEELERAVEFRPVDPVINDHLGDALWRVGRELEAEFQWKRALSFDPDDKDAERIKRKLTVGLDVVLREEDAAADAPSATAKDDG